MAPVLRYKLKLRDGTVVESLELATLNAMAQIGRIQCGDKVAFMGTEDWMRISDVPGLGRQTPTRAAIQVFKSTRLREPLIPIAAECAKVEQEVATHCEVVGVPPADKGVYELKSESGQSQYWYICDGTVSGPVSIDVLIGHTATGFIRPDSPISPSPTGPWMKAWDNSCLRMKFSKVHAASGNRTTDRQHAKEVPAQEGASIAGDLEESHRRGTMLLLVPCFGVFITCGIAFVSVLNEAQYWFVVIPVSFCTSYMVWRDASMLGMNSVEKNGKWQIVPIAWAAGTLYLFPLVYPAYMFERSRFGAQQYLGHATVIVFALFFGPWMIARVFS